MSVSQRERERERERERTTASKIREALIEGNTETASSKEIRDVRVVCLALGRAVNQEREEQGTDG